jgi:hypothetical protein
MSAVLFIAGLIAYLLIEYAIYDRESTLLCDLDGEFKKSHSSKSKSGSPTK